MRDKTRSNSESKSNEDAMTFIDSDRVVVYSSSPSQVWGSINGLRKVDSAFHPRYIVSINEYQACWVLNTEGLSSDRPQIGTSVHAPQRPMVTCIMMGTVVPGPHGLLCH
ncbi:hypothetical protein TNCV_3651851 [Trichonephila clavipes]|uniref:Uncharacterized protein n=1 Tax=Trichonephila clavipes TaxID=2585209 RepID=A0A8X6VFX6_TRICX|nr:hypothetical protein TNCV_3651851 [Trichonephila clavipes]